MKILESAGIELSQSAFLLESDPVSCAKTEIASNIKITIESLIFYFSFFIF